MKPSDRRLVPLRRLALLCAVMVLAVTGLSATIRLTRAGLGCADWPRCYGQNLRDAQRGVAPVDNDQPAIVIARLAHRIAAGIVLLLVLTMVLICFGGRPVLRSDASRALALLALTLGLAVLGRWSSGARIPAVTIGNLLGGFAMLALCMRLAVAGRPPRAPVLRVWAAAAMLLLLVQVAVGGLISASYAALSCNAWDDCLRAARGAGWQMLDPWREPMLLPAPAADAAGALAQLLHRVLALALLAVLCPLAVVAWRRGEPGKAVTLLALLGAQASIGLLMVDHSLPLALAWLHNLLGAGLLAAVALLL